MLYMLYDIILLESFTFFYKSYDFVTITMIMLFDVTNVWQCGLVTLTLTLVLKIKNKNKNKNKNEK